ncbi:MAG TPA: S1/P1 Nuclease [Bacteroidetes bacterium]|nr:S1/P1 Nuclease [Bacteroidota bacterium]
MKKICSLAFLFVVFISTRVDSWGFYGHSRINRIAVFTLPPQMLSFYKDNIEFLTTHAVDPDKRRYAIKEEAPRHYIDLDRYGKYPYADVPHHWNDAVAHFGEDTLNAHGIVPWYVNTMFYRLVDAFKEKNKFKILHLSADIGHYIADAHVPLHCTRNYNGQLTGQTGIHAFWESRLPELYGENYDYFVGKAELIDNTSDFIWKVVLTSASEVDSVLSIEKKLSQEFPTDKKYSYEQRGDITVRVYSEEYSKEYSNRLQGMVERKMRAAILAVGSFWYTAWVTAGKPDLSTLKDVQLSADDLKELDQLDENWKAGKIIGREEE